MDSENKIYYFGHYIPDEVYEDYKKMEKIKELIKNVTINDNELSKNDIRLIDDLIASMSDHFKQMKRHRPHLDEKQCPRK